MDYSHNEGADFTLSRFENMLKTNDILFFDAEEFEIIIEHYLETGRLGLARKAVKIALSQHPHSSDLKLLKVEILLFENKVNQADELLNSLYEYEPSNPDIYIHKANILSKQDRHQEAVELLEIADNLLEEDEDVHSLIAMEYLFMEDYERAKLYFTKCLDADPEDVAALHNIIYCYDFLDQTEGAIEFLNNFINQQPYSEIAWHQLGLQYVILEDYQSALSCFDFAIISDDHFVGAYMEKAKTLEKLKKYEEAIDCYRTTFELEEATAFAHLRIGRCFEKLGQKDLALDHYNKALQKDPLMDKTWMTITDFYLRRKQYKEALYYIERAITIDEENILYWKRYAKINNKLKHLNSEEKIFHKEVEFGNYDFETWITRCDILIGLQEFETAIDILNQAQLHYQNTSEIEYRFAGLYYQIGKKSRAFKHLKRAIHLDCDYAIILEDLFPEVFADPKVRALLEKNGFFE